MGLELSVIMSREGWRLTLIEKGQVGDSIRGKQDGQELPETGPSQYGSVGKGDCHPSLVT